MRLIDTNILVHAVDEDSPKKQRAQDVLNYYLGTGEAVVSLQSILEMYSALTKSMSTAKAKFAAEEILKARSFKKIHSDKDDFFEALNMAHKNGLKRSEVFDALLAASAKKNGITTILTDNPKHFQGLGLKVESLETATLSKEF